MTAQDANLIFSEDQDLGAQAVGSAVSTNIIDTGVANSKIGDVDPVILEVRVVESFDSADDTETFKVELKDCSTVGGSYVTKLSTRVFAHAELQLPSTGVPLKLYEGAIPYGLARYLELLYTVAAKDLTAGKITAFLRAPF